MKGEMNLKGKKVTVLGLGISGFESALFLRKKDALVFVSEIARNESVLEYQNKLNEHGIEMEYGKHSVERIFESDWIVISPGIKPQSEIYRTVASQKRDCLISEIELAARFLPCEMIAVTGTNGKTTTTSLIAGLFNFFGVHAIACGNIGNAFVGEIENLKPESKAVVEVSSFQLENIKDFRPHVALLLNVTPDHYDWHGGPERYLAAKARIFENQTSGDFAILNWEDEPSRTLVPSLRSKALYFNRGPVKGPRFAVDNPNWDAVRRVSEIYGFDPEKTEKFLENFPGIDHRMEKVVSRDGICYINDSKSTNPSSLEWALNRMREPAILLCGGRNKGNDFGIMKELVGQKVKHCFVFGEAAGEMENAWKDAVSVLHCRDMREALCAARGIAKAGDTILLSPACASFDQFKNYEDRGQKFKEMVLA